ncbi:MAG: ABC transporter ATP-binding protein [Deltaproteobacteria bacterium]|nr:ABC transporter ATP-binding protein [Deltaproteobacteria bacterium]
MSDFVVEAKGVTRTFMTGDVKVRALRGVDMAVERGDFVAVAGPSGSGKTTLFNLLGGLDDPTDGEVFVNGEPLAGMNPRRRSRLRLDKIGFVFQAYNLIPVLTAYENVEYPLILKKVPAAQRLKRVQELLDAVGLGGMLKRRPNQMSGGQQQRVAIARALVCDPVMVLADEPTANVDSETGEALLDLMRKLNAEKNLTFLFSTHDPMVMAAARRLIRLKDGLIDTDVRQNGEGVDASVPAGA